MSLNVGSSLFYATLIRPLKTRTDEDIDIIYNYLRKLEVFDRLQDDPLRAVCRIARLERWPANYILYKKGQVATCWYILLSGSVVMDKQIYLPIGCFGKRSNMNLRRDSDCIIIQPADMIVIDYPDVQRITVHHNNKFLPTNSMAISVPTPILKNDSNNNHNNDGTDKLRSCDFTSFNGGLQFRVPPANAFQRHIHNNSINNYDSQRRQYNSQYANEQQQQLARKSVTVLSTQKPPDYSGPAVAISDYNNARYASSSNNINNGDNANRSNTIYLPVDSHPEKTSNSALRTQLNGCHITTKMIPSSTSRSVHIHGTHNDVNSNSNIRVKMIGQTSANTLNSKNDGTMHFGNSIAHYHPAQQSHHIRSGSAHDTTTTPTSSTYFQQQQQQPQHYQLKAKNAGNSDGISTSVFETSNSTLSTASTSTISYVPMEHSPNNFGAPTRNVRRSFHMDELQHLETLRLVRRQQEQFNQAAQKRSEVPPPLPQLRYGKRWINTSSAQSSVPQYCNEVKLSNCVPISHAVETDSGAEFFATNAQNYKRSTMNAQKTSLSFANETTLNRNDCDSGVDYGTITKTQSDAINLIGEEVAVTTKKSTQQYPPPPPYQRQFHQRKCSDAASIGSGSDGSGNPGATIVKVRSHYGYGGAKRLLRARSTASSTSTADGDALSGLPDAAADSDDEDEDEDEESCPSHDSFQELRDNVRECLEKEPAERCADDIAILMDFMQQMPALACLPLSIKRQLCLKMVFAIVPTAGTVIMQHGEKIDAWSVVVNGAVEHVRASTGERVEYRLGDCFGAQPQPQVQYQDGEMRTLFDDCEFVLIEHTDYCSIMCTLSEHIEREADDVTGEVVREAERKVVGNHVELLTTKALPERLVQQLLEEAADFAPASTAVVGGSDVYFVEDFLLMYRVFIDDPTTIVRRLLNWFYGAALTSSPSPSSSTAVAAAAADESMDAAQQHAQQKRRERVARIFLLWVNNHFSDFENDHEMMRLLDAFEKMLESVGMHNQQSLLNITCSVKSKPRVVTLTRSNRAQNLPFDVLGGRLAGGNANATSTTTSAFGNAPTLNGIFISHVEPNSQAEKNGLSRGDEILEMNGQSFRNITLAKAFELLKESTHLSLTLKSNLVGFKEILARQEDDLVAATAQINIVPEANGFLQTNESRSQACVGSPASSDRRRTVCHGTPHAADAIGGVSYPSGSTPASSGHGTSSSKASMFEKLFTLLKGSSVTSHEHNRHAYNDENDYDSTDEAFVPNSLRASRSNPDISSHIHVIHPSSAASAVIAAATASNNAHNTNNTSNRHSSFSTGSGASSLSGGQAPVGSASASSSYTHCEQAIKVYRGDQSFRYFIVYPDTTARSVVRMALQEFGMLDNASNSSAASNGTPAAAGDWALCECTVTRESVIKQCRLPDEMQNLAERIGLNSRFYLKNNNKSENLIPDELAPDVLKESRISLYNLNAQFLATQLTYQDFGVFSSIDSIEYVNSLFKLNERRSDADWPHIRQFEALFNREMWWVVTEICCERNVYRRSKLVKKFIKIARFCRDLRNFNSMFAIISGLDKPAVRRLAHTWERVSGKYVKMFEDIQQLMDPSRNMSKYRQPLQQAMLDPPGIPIYPVLRKDLIFAHEVKPTMCERLVNFEKLRLIARIIRSHARLSSVQYDTETVTSQMLQGATGSGLVGSASAAAVRKFGGGGASRQAGGLSMNASSGANTIGAGGSGQSARKKVYERMLMIRKVKAYLAEMPYIDCETELDQRSLECEPLAPGSTMSGGGVGISSAGGLDHHHTSAAGAGAAVPTPALYRPVARRRMASPSPSSISSHSARSSTNAASAAAAEFHQRQKHTTKFGVESPQAVKKMLSLAQPSKTSGRSGTLSHDSNSLADEPRKKKSTALTNPLKKIPSFNSSSGHGSGSTGSASSVGNTATLTRRTADANVPSSLPSDCAERRVD